MAKPGFGDHLADEIYITSGEVARILRVSPKTVARWAKEGRLPHLVTLGGHRRFPAGPIHELARELQVVDTPSIADDHPSEQHRFPD